MVGFSLCLSQPKELMQENELQDGTNAGVVLCGHKDMTEKISKQMQASGVSKEKILLNW